MLADFLQARGFGPAGIQSADDLDQPDRINKVVDFAKASRPDTLDALSNATLAIAA